MSVQITITLVFSDAAAAAEAMARLANPTAPAAPVQSPAPAAGKPKAEKPAAPASKPAADAAATSSAATPAAASEPKADVKPAVLPYDALRVRVVKLASMNKDAIAPILAHFGVDHFTKVAEERRGEALELVNEALAKLESVA